MGIQLQGTLPILLGVSRQAEHVTGLAGQDQRVAFQMGMIQAVGQLFERFLGLVLPQQESTAEIGPMCGVLVVVLETLDRRFQALLVAAPQRLAAPGKASVRVAPGLITPETDEQQEYQSDLQSATYHEHFSN
jgi:hypothetical protein